VITRKITRKDIDQNLELTRMKMKEYITPEDIDVIFDTLDDMYNDKKELINKLTETTKQYKELYCKTHNIPLNAIVEWR